MSQQKSPDNAPRKLLHITITEPEVLRRCYLPFLRNGGLFVPTDEPYSLRQQLFLVLKLPGAMQVQGVLTRVACLTPAQAHDGRVMGVGLAFPEAAQALNNHIESLIAMPPDADVV